MAKQDKTAHPKACCAPRRSFLACAIATILGLLAFLPAALSGIVAFFSPISQKGRQGLFVRLTTLGELPTDGTPRKFPVVAERSDAWTLSREAVGAVYLRRLADDTVEAFQVICPHAGCAVEYFSGNDTEGDASGQFVCPCHQARFDLSGKRLDEHSRSPRDLDTLVAEVRNGDEVWVQFQTFQTGVSEKVPLS